MYALRQEILPPSGVEFATILRLTPSTIGEIPISGVDDHTETHVLSNIVVARSNFVRIYEVREQDAPTEPEVEGGNRAEESKTLRFYFVREHHLHGVVTGLEGVKTMATVEDKLERLLISFKDAKLALLEWSDAVHDLITVSIHTYERAPQLLALDSALFRARLRSDSLSRCVALSLPRDSLAILPFYQSSAELDVNEQDTNQSKDVPYSPSFILDLPNDVNESIRNVVDFVFLPGFNNPTLAVLYQTKQSWTGRLNEFKDTTKLVIFTLDLVAQRYPIITAAENLPHDCFSLFPCSPVLGGVVIVACNSILYVDQSSRRVCLPLNGWAPRMSDMTMQQLAPEESTRILELEGCQCAFADEKTLFVTTRDGSIYPLEIVVDGKTVSKLSLGPLVVQTTIPSAVNVIHENYLFIGSINSPSVLLKIDHVEESFNAEMETPPSTSNHQNGMDVDDDDDDLYGMSDEPTVPLSNGIFGGCTAVRTKTTLRLQLVDSLPAYGSISDLTFSLARNGDRPVSELVAATGLGSLGGFTLFQRDLPSRTKRKLHAIGGARGMWSLPVRPAAKANGVTQVSSLVPIENDSVIISTDANPSPGLSRIASRSSKNDISITTRIPGTTVGAGSFFNRTAILHVMTNCIRVLEPDGTERQIIKDMDGNMPRPKIRACSICDPFVFVLREDDSIGLFIGELERGKIRRKDMSPMGDRSSRYIAGCFFTNASAPLRVHTTTISNGSTSPTLGSTNPGQGQWLLLVRPQGVMEIWALPKLTLVFSTGAIATLQTVLVDTLEEAATSLPQDPPRKPQNLDIDQILVAPLGETLVKLYLLVLLRSGQLAVYEVLPTSITPEASSPLRTSSLLIKFVKVVSRFFEIPKQEEPEKTVLADHKKIFRTFIPFDTSPARNSNFSGVFFTGDQPSWIVSTDKGGVQIYGSGHGVVHAFTACSLWESKGDFLLYSDEGPSLLEWMPSLDLTTPLPSRSIPCGRAYSNIAFDSATSLIVAATVLKARFSSFDEDGNKLWEPDALNVCDPQTECSALELISPELWITMDGFEFATNEVVNAVEIVNLETSSTDSGTKDFVAVGTTINRGEDLAVKGSTYIFEIVEVVPDRSQPLKRWFKLSLRCRDDAKGPVTALCGFNGYLVSSMGQKIFVRAFDFDERLVGVAFLDVGVYVSSLRTLKNLLLVGDAVKSVWFVAFQEDPYKLVILAKDVNQVCVTCSDFLFANGDMSIVTGSEEGVLRIYEFDPSDPESRNGQHLLLRTEFQEASEYRCSATVARRTKEDSVLPQARLICGHADGSLSSLTPVAEAASKRLQLLQGQLTRNIQHVAGLNPRASRIVRNEFFSKPLSKGILDGYLIMEFDALSIARQDEVTRQIGTDRETILHDLSGLLGSW